MHQPQTPHHPPNQQYSQNQQSNIQRIDPSVGVTTFQLNISSNFLEKQQRHFEIKFYEGHSSFNAQHMLKNDSERLKSERTAETKTVTISPIKPQKAYTQKQKNQVESSKVINLEQKQKNASHNELMVPENGAYKLEQTGFKKRVCQSYSMNRIYASINLQPRQALKRKLTRGMYSIASRRYQPIIDSRQIFDDQDLNNSVVGPDECRLWRNLMNKYFLRTNKADKIKRKTIIKSEIKLISDENEGRQETKKQRKPRIKKRQDLLIKKEEQDPSEMISEQLQQSNKLNDQFKNGQLIEAKKEEDLESKRNTNAKKSQAKHIQIEN